MSGILPRAKFDVRETTNNVGETTKNPGNIPDFAQRCPEFYQDLVKLCVYVCMWGVSKTYSTPEGGGTETFFTRKLFSGTFISEKCKF